MGAGGPEAGMAPGWHGVTGAGSFQAPKPKLQTGDSPLPSHAGLGLRARTGGSPSFQSRASTAGAKCRRMRTAVGPEALCGEQQPTAPQAHDGSQALR